MIMGQIMKHSYHKGVSKNARNFVKENYSADLMCKNTLEIYQNLIN